MMYTYCRLLLFLCLLPIMVGCEPNSPEDFREEGESVTRSLIKELQTIHNREELLHSIGSLQRHFDRLVDLMIAAKEFFDRYPDRERDGPHVVNHELGDRLRFELNRLYQLEGGGQLIEKSREKALRRLDAHEHRPVKKY